MNFIVRPSRADEWQVLKHLRISALTRDPKAFGPTADEALTFDDAYWQRFATYFASQWRQLFIAVTPPDLIEAHRSDNEIRFDDFYGLISAVVDREGTGHLGAFWVDPRTRGTGLGAKLFDAALDWLESDLHCPRIELSVTEGNDQAEAMYRRRGFSRGGKFEPLREGSTLRNVHMMKTLGQPPSKQT